MQEEELKPLYDAVPKEMPAPSYWPLLTAASICFMLWGLITSWMLFVAGVIGTAITIIVWIKQAVYDGRK